MSVAGDDVGELALFGSYFSTFEQDSGEKFIDTHPNAILNSLGTYDVLTVFDAGLVDYRVFRGAQIESLRVIDRHCSNELDGPRFKGCVAAEHNVLQAHDLELISEAAAVNRFSLQLPRQTVDPIFANALTDFIEYHDPAQVSYGFAIDFCDIPIPENAYSVTVAMKLQENDTVAALLAATGGNVGYIDTLIETSRSEGVASINDEVTIMSSNNESLRFQGTGVAGLREAQQKQCN